MGNGYTWCGNNPWSHRDPYGTIPWRNWGCEEWTSAAKCVASGVIEDLKDALDFSWLKSVFGDMKKAIEDVQDALAEFDRRLREDGLAEVAIDTVSDLSPTLCLLLQGCCLDPCEFGKKLGGAVSEIGTSVVTGGGRLGLKVNDDERESGESGDPDGSSRKGEGDDDSTSVGEGSCTGDYCLVGDTLVVMGDGSTKPISEIQPGDRVLPTMLQELPTRELGSEVWSRVDLVVEQSRRGWGKGTEVSFLVTEDELESWQRRALGRFYMSNYFAEVEGWALVSRIQQVEVPNGDGRIVMATYKSRSRDVLNLETSGGAILGITPGHPLLGHDGEWTTAGGGERGALLYSHFDPAGLRVTGSSWGAGGESGIDVFDIQVDCDCSFILSSGIVSHNAPGSPRKCGEEDGRKIKYGDDVSTLPLRGQSLNSGGKKLRELGLHERVTKTGRHEFYDPKTGGVRAAWDPKNSKGGNHWHKFAPDTSKKIPLNDAGHVVGSTEPKAHIPSK
jgi:hypothetical protein